MPLSSQDQALHHAVKTKQPLSNIKQCILAGGNVNSQTVEGSVLHIAVANNDFPLIQLLVETHHADLNLINHAFMSPIDLAENNEQVLNYLIDKHQSLNLHQLEKNIEFCLEYYQGTTQNEDNDRLLLDYIVSKLTHVNIDTLRKKTVLAQGQAINWDKYVGHLRALAALDKKNGKVEGFFPSDFLPLRIRSFFEIIIKMQKKILSAEAVVKTIGNTSENKHTYFLSKLKQEILVEIETLRIMEFSKKELAHHNIIAKNILTKITALPLNAEYCIATGWERHTVYVSLKKITNEIDKIQPRVDNLGAGSGSGNKYIDANAKQLTILHFPQSNIQPMSVKPCVLKLPANILKYIENVIFSVKQAVNRDSGIALIYNVVNHQVALEQLNNLPFFPVQTVGNCTAEAHQIGLRLRLGEESLFQGLLGEELKIASQKISVFKSELILPLIDNFFQKEQMKRGLPQSFEQDLSRYYSLNPHIDVPFLGKNALSYDDCNFNLVVSAAIPQSKEVLNDQVNITYKKHSNHFSYSWKDQAPETFDRKLIETIPVVLQDIFKECKGLTQRILIMGSAGSGKSTLLQKIAYDWAKGKLWPKKFKWLVHIRLRNLTSNNYPVKSNQSAYSLLEIVKQECDPAKDRFDINNIDLNAVLWLLDGFDELVKQIPPQLQPACKELFAAHAMIITTRYYQFPDFKLDAHLELLGFKDEHIYQYVNAYFSDTASMENKKAQLLLKRLKMSPAAWSLARSPLMLGFTCWLYSMRENIFETATELYQQISDTLPYQNTLFLGLNKFEREETMELLEALSFQAMQQEESGVIDCKIIDNLLKVLQQQETSNSLTHKPLLFHKISSNKLIIKINALLSTGFLKVYNYDAERLPMQLHFAHPTFQEFFTARYISKKFIQQQEIKVLSKFPGYLPEQLKKVEEFVSIYKLDRSYERVWWFVAGILSKENKESMQAFFEIFKNPPYDLIGICEAALLMRCLDETELDPQLIKSSSIFDVALVCLNNAILCSNYKIRSIFAKYLNLCPHIFNHDYVLNYLIENLNDKNGKDIQIATLSFLNFIENKFLAPILIDALFDIYNACEFRTTIMAASILRQLALEDEKILDRYLGGSAVLGPDIYFANIRDFAHIALTLPIKTILLKHKQVIVDILTKEQLLELAKNDKSFQSFLLDLARIPDSYDHHCAKAIFVMLNLGVAEEMFIANTLYKIGFHEELASYSAVESSLKLMFTMPALQKKILAKLLSLLDTRDWLLAVKIFKHDLKALQSSHIDKIVDVIYTQPWDYSLVDLVSSLAMMKTDNYFISKLISQLIMPKNNDINTEKWESIFIALALMYPQVISLIQTVLQTYPPNLTMLTNRINNKFIMLGIASPLKLCLFERAFQIHEEKIRIIAIEKFLELDLIDNKVIESLVLAMDKNKFSEFYWAGASALAKLAIKHIEMLDLVLALRPSIAIEVFNKLGTVSPDQFKKICALLDDNMISSELREKILNLISLFPTDKIVYPISNPLASSNEITSLLQNYCESFNVNNLEKILDYFLNHLTPLKLDNNGLSFEYQGIPCQFLFDNEQASHFIRDWADLIKKSYLAAYTMEIEEVESNERGMTFT